MRSAYLLQRASALNAFTWSGHTRMRAYWLPSSMVSSAGYICDGVIFSYAPVVVFPYTRSMYCSPGQSANALLPISMLSGAYTVPLLALKKRTMRSCGWLR